MISTRPDVRAFFDEVVRTEAYDHIMKNLFASACGAAVGEKKWELHKDFCEAEVLPNMSFIVSVAQDDEDE